MRPSSWAEIVGQDEVKHTLMRLVEQKSPLSLLLWGPPGSGKTTLARLYARSFRARFITLSAVLGSAAELKKILTEEETPLLGPLILFVDEIHRFNRSQQDLFLPYLEGGQIILIGATTENPSFALNPALLSRLRVLKLSTLSESALAQIIARYEGTVPPEISQQVVAFAQGDGRTCINLLENWEQGIALQRRSPLYDRDREGHYNLISALHKSVRGSDPDAALYWLARMLNGGEDPRFIARRLTRMASEDVGLADPQALAIALDGAAAYERLGSPEGDLSLAQVTVYLALAPKSNALYTAWDAARADAEATGHLDPPPAILNAPTALMKEMGYGTAYQYDHDLPQGFSGQHYFPGDRKQYYHPVERGFEREARARLAYFENLRKKRDGGV